MTDDRKDNQNRTGELWQEDLFSGALPANPAAKEDGGPMPLYGGVTADTSQEPDGDFNGENGDRNRKEGFPQLAVYVAGLAVLAVLAGACGFLIGRISANQKEKKSLRADLTYGDVSPEKVSKFEEIYRFIAENYYAKADPNAMLEGAIEGMVESIHDPYGNYYVPGNMSGYTDYVDGTYNGIGIQVRQENGEIVITDVLEGTTAAKAGIRKNSVLEKVNGQPVGELPVSDLRNLLSAADTSVLLSVRNSDGTRTEAECRVEVIVKKTVFGKDLGGGIKYVRIEQFISKTGEEFNTVLASLKEGGMNGLIVDLRDNPGGYVSEAVAVSDVLLGRGVVAVSRDRNGKVVRQYESDGNEIQVPTVLLVNGNTASAAELLTGAFRDMKKGEIVGEHTYGKALAQINESFEDGSGIVLSAYTYYTPSGECIDKVGIEPTVTVLPEESVKYLKPDQIPAEKDLPLQKALEILTNK